MSSKYLTIKNLMALFGVSHMTIRHWREGTAGREALPVEAIKDQPRAVGFLPAKVKAWAKKHKVEMNCEPATLLGTESVKPGPKAKAVKKAPAKQVLADRIRKAATKKPSPAKGTKVAARPRAAATEAAVTA